MNRQIKKLLLAAQVWLVSILSLFIATQVQGQTPANTQPSVDKIKWAQVSSLEPYSSFFPNKLDSSRNDIYSGLMKQFETAWRSSGNGTTGREIAILIFRMWDGSYTARFQGYTNQYHCSTFTWSPAAIAIVHTHPNCCDPRPGSTDRLVADKYGVPNFTITSSGMYEYDPATKSTTKVLNGLDWMNPNAIEMMSIYFFVHRDLPSLDSLIGVTSRPHIQVQ